MTIVQDVKITVVFRAYDDNGNMIFLPNGEGGVAPTLTFEGHTALTQEGFTGIRSRFQEEREKLKKELEAAVPTEEIAAQDNAESDNAATE